MQHTRNVQKKIAGSQRGVQLLYFGLQGRYLYEIALWLHAYSGMDMHFEPVDEPRGRLEVLTNPCINRACQQLVKHVSSK